MTARQQGSRRRHADLFGRPVRAATPGLWARAGLVAMACLVGLLSPLATAQAPGDALGVEVEPLDHALRPHQAQTVLVHVKAACDPGRVMSEIVLFFEGPDWLDARFQRDRLQPKDGGCDGGVSRQAVGLTLRTEPGAPAIEDAAATVRAVQGEAEASAPLAISVAAVVDIEAEGLALRELVSDRDGVARASFRVINAGNTAVRVSVVVTTGTLVAGPEPFIVPAVADGAAPEATIVPVTLDLRAPAEDVPAMVLISAVGVSDETLSDEVRAPVPIVAAGRSVPPSPLWGALAMAGVAARALKRAH